MENQAQYVEASKTRDMIEACKANPWIISTFVFAIVAIALIVPYLGLTGKVISEEDAGTALLSLYTSQGVTGLTLDSVKEVSGVYEVSFLYNGQAVPVYLTKDGKLAGTLSAVPTAGDTNTASQTEPKQTTVPKTAKPKVELFVMTHCPYGTQAEKGFIPFMEAFGNNVDAEIRFVHYFMHGDKEEAETYTQICIREEQSDKFLTYLREFLVEGNSANALAKAKIDSTKLADCVDKRAKALYAEDSKLSNQYGVQGSPTVIINGVESSAGRSPVAYLTAACDAFNSAPSECSSLKLDSATPGAMWGWDGATASTGAAASCN